jgi:hypothetical protein
MEKKLVQPNDSRRESAMFDYNKVESEIKQIINKIEELPNPPIVWKRPPFTGEARHKFALRSDEDVYSLVPKIPGAGKIVVDKNQAGEISVKIYGEEQSRKKKFFGWNLGLTQKSLLMHIPLMDRGRIISWLPSETDGYRRKLISENILAMADVLGLDSKDEVSAQKSIWVMIRKWARTDVEDWARSRGAEFLCVEEDVGGRSFYESLGYKNGVIKKLTNEAD